MWAYSWSQFDVLPDGNVECTMSQCAHGTQPPPDNNINQKRKKNEKKYCWSRQRHTKEINKNNETFTELILCPLLLSSLHKRRRTRSINGIENEERKKQQQQHKFIKIENSDFKSPRNKIGQFMCTRTQGFAAEIVARERDCDCDRDRDRMLLVEWIRIERVV